MTEQQQREACAELAQRIGWRFEPEVDNWFRQTGRQIWRHPVTLIERQLPPDYFTDAVALRELMLWLAKQDKDIQFNFIRIIDESIPDGTPYMIGILTAPLPVIARAACKALGIKVSE